MQFMLFEFDLVIVNEPRVFFSVKIELQSIFQTCNSNQKGNVLLNLGVRTTPLTKKFSIVSFFILKNNMNFHNFYRKRPDESNLVGERTGLHNSYCFFLYLLYSIIIFKYCSGRLLCNENPCDS